MFDYLTYQGRCYQTKTLDCTMDEYKIVDGRLIHDEWHYEETPKEKRPYPNAEPGTLEAFAGSLTRVIDRKDVDLNFHGHLTGCGDFGNPCENFDAKFTDGDLVEWLEDTAEGDKK